MSKQNRQPELAIDFNGLREELARVERLLGSVKTDEERVFVYMRLVNAGQRLTQESGMIANQLSSKCVDRLDPQIAH